MSHNNATSAMPGFFFYPSDTTGLVELTFDERCTLLLNQGNYMVGLWKGDPSMKIDMECALTNGRIPTHRTPGAKIPEYGHVPFDLAMPVESRSASKAIHYGKGFEQLPYVNRKLESIEYRNRKIRRLQEFLKFTDDYVNNRRRLKNASLHMKVMYKRAVKSKMRADNNDG